MKRFAAVVGVVAVIALAAMGFAVKAQKAAEIAQQEALDAKDNLRINSRKSRSKLFTCL